MAYNMETSASHHNIYNYPEHLNPFYEDEQHKRLRFWKFGSSRSKSKNSERRGSNFSLDTLKEMWEFKTFRPKKKSSSLGVYKTSESPPPLRRESDYNSNYNTISSTPSGYRNTITLGTYNEFERNVPYRSSLQGQSRANNELGFQRNNRYRSTVQNGYATYSGIATPNPRPRLSVNQSLYSAPSQQSLNPFDDEDSCSLISASGSISSPSKRPGRKKRRAPPPPVPKRLQLTDSDAEMSSQNTASSSIEVNTSANGSTHGEELKILELSNLTAEIESFVKTTTEDNSEQPIKGTENNSVSQTHPVAEGSSSVTASSTNQLTSHLLVIKVEEEKLDSAPNIEEEKLSIIEEMKTSEENSVNLSSTSKITLHSVADPKIEKEKEIRDLPLKVEKKDSTPEIEDECLNRVEEMKTSEQNFDNISSTSQITSHLVAEKEKRKLLLQVEEEKRDLNESSVKIEQNLILSSNEPTKKANTPKPEKETAILTNNITSNVSKSSIIQTQNVNGLEKPLNTVTKIEVEVKSPNIMKIEEKIEEPTTPISQDVEFRLESMALPQVPTPAKRHKIRQTEGSISLKIVEDSDVSPAAKTAKTEKEDENSNLNSKIVKTENYEFKVKYIPLKDEPQPEPIASSSPSPSKEEKRPSPSENGQKRSVKDIIDSINKSQSLLKVNQENAKNENTKIKELSQTEKELQRLLDEMNYTSRSSTIIRSSKQDISHLAEDEIENLFDKSAIRTKKSPTKDLKLGDDGSGHDWNPVPKPRRSKNFS